jgi:hypothetical protein
MFRSVRPFPEWDDWEWACSANGRYIYVVRSIGHQFIHLRGQRPRWPKK